jgi:death on curing protein
VTDYLTVADILAIHEDLIERYRGSHGLRDPGQLEAALFRPQTGYYPDLVAEAAALWESLAQNHPFVDGNKRAAFAGMYTFLAINGVTVTADADVIWAFISELYATGTFHFERLEPWLRANTKPG